MVIRFVLIGLLLAAPATTALAGGPYVGASGGVSFVHQSDVTYTEKYAWTSADFVGDMTFHTGYAFNAAVGYNFDRFRLEAEYGHKAADANKVSATNSSLWALAPLVNSNLTVDSYMVNAYYDHANAEIVRPFIGGGIGFAKVEMNGNVDNNFSDTGFGYQVMAGLTGELVKHVNLDLYYRFMGTSFELKKDRYPFSSTTISPYHSSNILAGLRYTF